MANQKLLLKTLARQKTDKIPLWIMRQAGRYLPEYQEVRKQAGNFMDLCFNPQLAAEVTLQPIRRFGFDAAIIFSDILVIPHALGVKVEFLVGEGPLVASSNFLKLMPESITSRLEKVYEAIALTKSLLPAETTLIGFAGAPWTISTYMVEGKSSKDFHKTKQLAYDQNPEYLHLIDILTESVIQHLINQIKAGAEVVQIFDSWAGVLNEDNFARFVISPTKKIVAKVREQFPNIPIIGFPRGAGLFYQQYVEQTEVNAVGLDSVLPFSYINDSLSAKTVLQGHLDPSYLLTSKTKLEHKVLEILENLAYHDYIFNLGHGILPETKIENVSFLVELVRNFRK